MRPRYLPLPLCLKRYGQLSRESTWPVSRTESTIPFDDRCVTSRFSQQFHNVGRLYELLQRSLTGIAPIRVVVQSLSIKEKEL